MVTRCGAPHDRAWAPACGRGANGVVHKPSPVLGEMQTPPPTPQPPPRPPNGAEASPQARSGLTCPDQPTAHPGDLLMVPGLNLQCHLTPAGSLLHQAVFGLRQTGPISFFTAPTRGRVGMGNGVSTERGGLPQLCPPPPPQPHPWLCFRRTSAAAVCACSSSSGTAGIDYMNKTDCAAAVLLVFPVSLPQEPPAS